MRVLTRIAYGLRPLARDPSLYNIIRAVRDRKLTYLDRWALLDLCDAVQQLERKRLAGALVEAGVALGGSAIVLARSKTLARPLHLYDVFGMIPPPSEHDGSDAHIRYAEIADGRAVGIRGDRYYGYEDELLKKVRKNFARFGIDPEKSTCALLAGAIRGNASH